MPSLHRLHGLLTPTVARKKPDLNATEKRFRISCSRLRKPHPFFYELQVQFRIFANAFLLSVHEHSKLLDLQSCSISCCLRTPLSKIVKLNRRSVKKKQKTSCSSSEKRRCENSGLFPFSDVHGVPIVVSCCHPASILLHKALASPTGIFHANQTEY